MRRLIATAAAVISAASPAPAQNPASNSLSFRDAVANAWSIAPDRRSYDARRASAAARRAAGGALFPSAPYVAGTHVNDRLAGSNYDYFTTQVEVGTPIWLPGEGTATQDAAQADADAVAADENAAHLALASRLLDLTAEAAQAAGARAVASRRLASAEALAADVSRRFRTGEAPETDALAAEADAASADIALNAAEAQLAAARASLAAVTGVESIPRFDAPAASPASSPPAPGAHPRIAAAERAVAAAQASARLVRLESRDNPEVALQGVNEKQPGARWDTRFGVMVRFPFATEARNAPRRAAAEEAVTQAMVQLEQARRAVAAGVRQADAALAAAERSAGAAARAADQLDKRRGQIERSWRLGESALIEVVRADALAFDAELARDKACTERDAGRERVRLAQGLLP
jgi:outer membrane protein TolC